jgi:phosphate transport system permease protein
MSNPLHYSLTPSYASLLKKRHGRQRRFCLMGLAAIIIALGFMFFLLVGIAYKGVSALRLTYVKVDIMVDPTILFSKSVSALEITQEEWRNANMTALLSKSWQKQLIGNEISNKQRALMQLLGRDAPHLLRRHLMNRPSDLGKAIHLWLPVSSDVDMVIKNIVPLVLGQTRLTAEQISWVNHLKQNNFFEVRWNPYFWQRADSRAPEVAGILGSFLGSLWVILVCLPLSVPLGVATAIYLEEFARKNWITDLIEVNMNNLAAVPSIIFGLLGLSVFLGFWGIGRSSPFAAGLTLALMILPTIVINTRYALQSVPPSIRHSALALGATPLQVVLHHTLPLSLPGIMTGTILGIARAIGETAPLLLIGMVAFIVDIPRNIFDAATVMPVQIFLWADSPEKGFTEKTAAAICVLLCVLILLNAIAVYIRQRFEKKW